MSGPGSIPRRHVILAALGGAALALGPASYLWGFSVDDALITARYAANIADGLGYRFNAGGPVTDGVTPLGFPYLLSPFAGGGTLDALRAAKGIGVVAWVVAAGVLGAAIDRSMEQIARGETIPVEEALERLRLRSLDEALSGKADTRG